MPADSMDDEWAAALQEQRNAEDSSDEGGEAEEDLFAGAPDEIGDDAPLLQDDDADVDWAAALKEQKATEKPARASSPAPSPAPSPASSPAPSKAPASKPQHSAESMEMLLKIPLDISVQLGDTHLLVNDLIQLGQGSIIELNKNATSEMDLFINGKLLGRGDVIVSNEHFGIRISKIITPEQRIKSLA